MRLAFDDSDPGERLRRYQLACGRTLMRTISEIFKIRRSGHEPGARRSIPPDSPLADHPEPTASGTVAAPILFPDPIGLLDSIEPMQMPAPVAVAVADSPLEPFDETNPIPAPPPPAPLLDPCSEGLWFEAGTAAGLADPPASPQTRRERTKDGRPAMSRAIPPMIIEALKMLVAQQRQAAAAAAIPAIPTATAAAGHALRWAAAARLDGLGEFLGALAADDQERPVGQLEPDAAVAAGDQRALAVAAGADAPEAVVGDRPEGHELDAADLGRAARSAGRPAPSRTRPGRRVGVTSVVMCSRKRTNDHEQAHAHDQPQQELGGPGVSGAADPPR